LRVAHVRMTSGREAVLGLANLMRPATGLRYRSVGELSYSESSDSRKISLSDERKLYMFEKITKDDCLFPYGA
jgi:hypothetical protein